MKKKKLSLNKKSIAKLNDETLKNVLGGGQDAFTSIAHCSKGGFTCAGGSGTCTCNITYTCICGNTGGCGS